MNKVVDSCFSTKNVSQDLNKYTEELKKTFRKTNVSESLKIHVVLHHLTNCLHFIKNDGLGIWSEQAGESIHREFLIFWNRYKISSVENPQYGSHLKKAVVEFSSKHI